MENSLPKRHSIRIPSYDYSQGGAYFVTVCSHQRKCVFGSIIESKTVLNDWGKIIEGCWLRAADIYPYVKLDCHVVMPNHFHGIIFIHESSFERLSLGIIVGQFKIAVTKRIRQITKNDHVKIWQRNYYEHIIRDEKSLDRIRHYIANNPFQWETDRNNPRNL